MVVYIMVMISCAYSCSLAQKYDSSGYDLIHVASAE